MQSAGQEPRRSLGHSKRQEYYIEKTIHPRQFPAELIERLVLALTQTGDWGLDPFLGVGTSIIAAIRHERRRGGAEIVPRHIEIAKERINQEIDGT